MVLEHSKNNTMHYLRKHVFICSSSFCSVNLAFELFVFQATVALQEVSWKEVYPMDFYSNQSLGPWTPNHPDNQPARPARRQTQVSVTAR